MQSPRRHIVGLLALCTLIFVCTLFAFGIHQRAAETLSGLERDAAAAEPLTTDVRMNKREAKNALNFAFKWDYNSPRMAGARLALAQYEPSTTWIPSKSDKPSRPSPLTPLEAATCYTCKDISFTKDVFTTSTGISNAASNVAAGTTNPPTPISYYMLYTSSIAESSKVSSNKHISFYMLYTPSPSANPSSLNIHNSSVTESLPLDYTPSTVCPLHNLTTTSWMTAPAITVTSVVTETWHRMVYSCNTTSVTTTATRDVTVNITLTVEKTVMPSLCSKVSSVQSMASTTSYVDNASWTHSLLVPISGNSTLPRGFSSTGLASSANIESEPSTTPSANLTTPSLTTSSVNNDVKDSSLPPAYPMSTPSGMLECADGSYAKSAHYCPGGLMYPPTSSSPGINWPAFTPSKVQRGPSTTSTVKFYKREEGDGEIEPTADTNEPAGQAPVRNIYATMFRRWRTHHYH